jgi:hypothetical protein
MLSSNTPSAATLVPSENCHSEEILANSGSLPPAVNFGKMITLAVLPGWQPNLLIRA